MTQPARERRDRRPLAIALTSAAVIAGGLLIANYEAILDSARELRMRGHVEMQRRSGHLEKIQGRELRERFDQGVVMLHSKKYEYAAKAFHRVLELSPKMPEAHANMGFALIGLQQWGTAHDFFLSAVELNPEQANAYYGLAIALEGLGELRGAMGAMRTYIHRSTKNEPEAYIARARSALWTWEEQLREEAAQAGEPSNSDEPEANAEAENK